MMEVSLIEKSAFSIFLFALTVSNVLADTRWLSIVATENNLAAAVGKLQSLAGKGTTLEVVNSNDCKNLHQGMFLVVTGVKGNKSEAEENVIRWRSEGIKDTYLRACEVIPKGRLDLGVPLLDNSIYRRPSNVINWTYEDAMSRIKSLTNSLIAVIQSRYEAIPNDVREGLRNSVSIIGEPNKVLIELEADCIDPELTANNDLVAVSCVNATAADHLLHIIRVYKIPTKKLIFERERCRNPLLSGDKLSCQEEHLDKQGNLHLKLSKYSLPIY